MAKKTKKQRAPIPLAPRPPRQTPILEEIEQLLRAHEERQTDDWELAPRLRQLAERGGRRRVFEEMVNRVRGPGDELRSSTIWALQLLGGGETISWLWEIARTPHKSTPARSAALAIIERLSGRVEAGEIPPDLAVKMYGPLGRLGRVARDVTEAETADAVETALLPFHLVLYRPPEAGASGKDIALDLVDAVARHSPSVPAADLLAALAETTPDDDIRRSAERGLSQLRSRNVEPASPAVLALREQHFHKAYTGGVPDQPRQIQIVVAWERQAGRISTLVFTVELEQGLGRLGQVSLIPEMSEPEFRRRYVEQAWLAGLPLREIPLSEARETVERSIETARRHGFPLPEDFQVLLPILERRVLRAG